MFISLSHGFILALGLILPLGAQNIFIFNQGALHQQFKHVLPAVLTASICDTLLISFAVLGISLLVLSLPWLQFMLFGVGFIFLIYIGWTIWSTETKKMKRDEKRLSPKKQILFSLSVSLLNPHAILDTIGVIGTNSLRYEGIDKWFFSIACVAVSWLWFFSLALCGKLLGQMDPNGKWLTFINRLSALIIWMVAIYIGFSFIKTLK
ncbi:LysE/ArgO family amino acid transporter [Terrilactibacillus laevilacticus]|uniref:LysE/ArgO family amino acid transporter n=1 Tax=Terrilactibacillus laevilacticus TaxID=1380157 RepID=A0ABW5PMP0_9BACI|nr:LysE/ArgO family amino acid transporter [Terrilactibacillus laevilacticus]